MMTMAERADKEGIPKDVKQAYHEALTVMKTAEWLRLGLNTDKKMIEKVTLRRFDTAASFQPMKTRILEEHMRTQWTMVHQGGLVSQANGGTMTRVVLETMRDNPTVVYGLRVRKVTEEMLLDELQVEMAALQRQSRVVNKLCEEACNLDYLMNKTQCFDLYRWEAIAQKKDIVLPWKSRESRLLKPMDHKAILLNNFVGVCKVCGVTIHDAKDKFEAWVALARAEWRSLQKKLPADAHGEADYNGEIMLNSWYFAWKSRSAEAAGSVSIAPLKPIMEFLATAHRNTTSVERTLKAIKAAEKHGCAEKSLVHANSALVVKEYIAQDPTLLADASSTFYLQFSHLWKTMFGQHWGCRTKRRADL